MITFLILVSCFACIVQLGGTFPLGSAQNNNSLPFSPSGGLGVPGIKANDTCSCQPGGPASGGLCWTIDFAPLPGGGDPKMPTTNC